MVREQPMAALEQRRRKKKPQSRKKKCKKKGRSLSRSQKQDSKHLVEVSVYPRPTLSEKKSSAFHACPDATWRYFALGIYVASCALKAVRYALYHFAHDRGDFH